MDASEEALKRATTVGESLRGLIESLAAHLDDVAETLEAHGYEPFNDFANSVRTQETAMVACIAENAEDLQATALEMLGLLAASEEAKGEARQSFAGVSQQVDAGLARCRSIRELSAVREETIIPDSGDELYGSYGRYKRIIEEHEQVPPDDDREPLLALVEDFYGASVQSLDSLHESYDEAFRALGDKVGEQERQIVAGKVGGEAAIDSAASPITKRPKVPVATAVGAIGEGVVQAIKAGFDPSKGIAGVAKEGLGAVAALGDAVDGTLQDSDKDSAFAKKTKSLARGFFSAAKSAKEHLAFTESMLSATGIDLPPAARLAFGIATKATSAIDLQALKNTGMLDICKEGAALGKDIWAIAKTPTNVISTFKHAASAIDHTVNLVGAIAKYVQTTPPKRTPKPVIEWITRISDAVKAYDESLDAYRKAPPSALPRKKPKASPGVRAVKLCQKIRTVAKSASSIMDKLEVPAFFGEAGNE